MAASGRSGRAWGWHRLADEWAARVVAAAAIRPGELVLDLGAGTGALTGHLVQAGARVVAVELHPGRAATLRRRFPDITVLEADATTLRLPARPFRVVASPPYHISADLLRMLLAAGPRLTAADLVLQRAVVRKYAGHANGASSAGRAGRIQDAGRPSTYLVHRHHRMSTGLVLPRHAFYPPPRVDSAVLKIRKR